MREGASSMTTSPRLSFGFPRDFPCAFAAMVATPSCRAVRARANDPDGLRTQRWVQLYAARIRRATTRFSVFTHSTHSLIRQRVATESPGIPRDGLEWRDTAAG